MIKKYDFGRYSYIRLYVQDCFSLPYVNTLPTQSKTYATDTCHAHFLVEYLG